MAETFKNGSEIGRPDAYLDMMLRKRFSYEYASEPVDFYLHSLEQAQRFVGLGREHILLDIGCNNGEPVLRSAAQTGTEAYTIGVDLHDVAYNEHPPKDNGNPPKELDQSRFTFMEADGQALPLPDNSARVTMAHNVLFRAQDAVMMLEEMKRVTEPDGLIVISTNARMHAWKRHYFEERAASYAYQKVALRNPQLKVEWPHAPAEGFYWEDVPSVLAMVGGLEPIYKKEQLGNTVIYHGIRLDDYLLSISYTAVRANVPLAFFAEWGMAWREYVRTAVAGFILADMNLYRTRHPGQEPCFLDPVRRGMVVLRKK